MKKFELNPISGTPVARLGGFGIVQMADVTPNARPDIREQLDNQRLDSEAAKQLKFIEQGGSDKHVTSVKQANWIKDQLFELKKKAKVIKMGNGNYKYEHTTATKQFVRHCQNKVSYDSKGFRGLVEHPL